MPQIYVFHQNGRIWEQKDGAAMNSPLSPIVANIFMESFEQEVLQQAKDNPRLWVHYVDNTFIIWQHGLEKLQPFQQHLNSLQDSIKLNL